MKPFLQALLSAKTARLVLDYLKVLAWPIVLLLGLFLFSHEIKTLLGRIDEATVGPSGVHLAARSGTGNPSSLVVTTSPSPAPSPLPDKSSRPDVWFSINNKPTTGLSCAERAKKALDGSGFSSSQNGDMTWGYKDEKLVGAVWCAAPNNSVLITVAGTSVTELQSKLTELENGFFNAG